MLRKALVALCCLILVSACTQPQATSCTDGQDKKYDTEWQCMEGHGDSHERWAYCSCLTSCNRAVGSVPYCDCIEKKYGQKCLIIAD